MSKQHSNQHLSTLDKEQSGGGAGIGSLWCLMVTQRGTSAGKPSALLAEFYEVDGEENLGLQHREGGREEGRGEGLLFEFLLLTLA